MPVANTTRGFLLISLFVVGCGHAPSTTSPVTQIAVLPFDGVGLPRTKVKRLQQAISTQLSKAAAVPLITPAHVDQSMGEQSSCRQITPETKIVCGIATGQQVAASHVVTGAIGGLGKTYILQLQLIDVQRESVTRSLEETYAGDLVAVNKSLPRLSYTLLEIKERSPWYSRWWLWTIIGVGVSAAITIPIALNSREDQQNPITPPPPL